MRAVCSVEGCDRVVVARGVCDTHYRRLRSGRDLTAPVARRRYGPDDRCSIPGCVEPPRSRMLCEKHYQRWWKTGDPLTPPQQVCLVCVHPMRNTIDALIAAGGSNREVAERFGVTVKSIAHHWTHHPTATRPDYAARVAVTKCHVCQHPEIDRIERLLRLRRQFVRTVPRYSGNSRTPITRTRAKRGSRLTHKAIAAQFGVEPGSIANHDTPEHQQRRALYEMGRLAALEEQG